MRKKNTLPGFKHMPEAPVEVSPSPMNTTDGVLAMIRRLEPEDQNEVVKTILSELAADRHTTVKELRIAGAQAEKNMVTFMEYAMNIEKLLAMKMEEKK